ncbi:MAG: LysR family transcriptional regulator [Rhodospirillaceae bacterium]
MNWDDLRIFLALVRDGTLSRTARKLRITQPTVGRRIARLEADLGAKLFDRLPDGYALTAAGARLVPLAEQMAASAEALDRTTAALSEAVDGTVRVSVHESLSPFIVERLDALRTRLPAVEFELFVTHIQVNLSKREADILIRDQLPDSSSLTARKLGAARYAVYGARAYVEANPDAATPARFRSCDWIGFDEEHARFAGYAWLLGKLGNRAPVFRTNNGMVLKEAVTSGKALGVLPCFAGDGREDLVRLTPPIAEVEETLWMLVHPDMKRRPAIRAVMDALVAMFNEDKTVLAGT